MSTRSRNVAVALAISVALASSSSASAADGDARFIDGADDAYHVSGPVAPPSAQPPNSLLSDPVADIVEAGFTTVQRRGSRHVYTAHLRIAGTPSGDYSYVVAGQFGDDCQLYHSVKPGIVSQARAFCGSSGSRPMFASFSGTSTIVDGHTMSATYTFDSAAARAFGGSIELGPLFAYSCVSGLEGTGCRPEEMLDVARDAVATFVVGSNQSKRQQG